MAEEVIHEAVRARATEKPEAIALDQDRGALSYRVLDAAGDVYAGTLAELGVRAGDIVPLLLPRSPQLVTVQLAVLKCGAAYVNLDRAWPANRQLEIIEQIEPGLIVSCDTAPRAECAELLILGEDDLTQIASRRSNFIPASVSGGAPATVFFTSGTTGHPKGIVVPHRAITRLFGQNGLSGFGPGHAMPQAAALPWDMYAFEVWGQLTAGGSVIFTADDLLIPSALRKLIDTANVDTVWLTTTLFNLFVDEDPACFRGVSQLYIGGEKLSSAHVRTFFRYNPAVALHNGYGPAENCMLTTTRLIEPSDCDIPDGIPVGVAVPESEVIILGESGLRCKRGELGEVCITGHGLAIGYLGQPELTAEKFPTVLVDDMSRRIYRTGDIGLLDEQGVLHFRGRCDRQVKINGHRIELEEIEAAARRLAAVRECIAIPVSNDDGRVTTIALCCIIERGKSGNNGAPWPPGSSESAVRNALRGVLPEYLVPKIVRMFDRFPVTANGKIDTSLLANSLGRQYARVTVVTRQQED